MCLPLSQLTNEQINKIKSKIFKQRSVIPTKRLQYYNFSVMRKILFTINPNSNIKEETKTTILEISKIFLKISCDNNNKRITVKCEFCGIGYKNKKSIYQHYKKCKKSITSSKRILPS